MLASELGKFLALRGHSVHFITLGVPYRLRGEFHENIRFHTVEANSYPVFEHAPLNMALAAKMREVAVAESLDVLHVHYAVPHAISAYLAAQMLLPKRLPIVTTLHGTDITLVGKDKTYAPVVTFSINESDAITAVSSNLREETYASFDIRKEIEVIYNFVDVRRFGKKPIDAFRKVIAPHGERILMHASNFRKIKRVADVIYVFNKIRKKIPSKLLLVGDGPERNMCEELARELGITDDIRFVGKQQDMEDIFAIADLFLLPSEYESFGLAALEAMAGGAPVITTNAGGLPEIITNGENGFMSAVGDVEDMSRNALAILKDEATFEKFRKNAKATAQCFDIMSIIPQYEDLYQRCMEAVKA